MMNYSASDEIHSGGAGVCVAQVKELRKISPANSKWSCVLCSEKQSVRKVYCRADTAKEVRNFVQQFNLARGQTAEADGRARLGFESPWDDAAADQNHHEDDEEEKVQHKFGLDEVHPGQKKTFKWDRFLPAEKVSPFLCLARHNYLDVYYARQSRVYVLLNMYRVIRFIPQHPNDPAQL
jgi:hypothetical protein